MRESCVLVFRSEVVNSVLRTGFLLCCIAIVGAKVASAAAPQLSKNRDDVLFRKLAYTDKKGTKMPYRLYVPPGYDSQKKYPLILWLHGANGRGTDNLLQISGGNELGTHLWTMVENQAQFPAFVLAPQCPNDRFWSEPELNQVSPQLQMALDILAVVEKDFPIDTDRVYLAGQSMGGLGVWSLLQMFPERWAAALVLCAYDNFTNVRGFLHVPVWVFQGDADLTVPVDLVRTMIKDLKKAGSQVQYSEYHKVGHEVWVQAFAEPELVGWVAAKKRGQ
jgi:predicted peptidase